jgi:hypothetical protein
LAWEPSSAIAVSMCARIMSLNNRQNDIFQ